jgi:hypothetical protein
MPSKLDQLIANVAWVLGRNGPAMMVKSGPDFAAQLTPKEIEKLPNRTYPTHSAKKAGVPELHFQWDHLWFQGCVELLVQVKEKGLAGLWEVAERDTFTYPSYAIVRLLRLAADGIETQATLAHLRQLFTTLHYIQARETVREVVQWTNIDFKPFELLMTLADVVTPRSDGDTIGLYIEQMKMELPPQLARQLK